MTADTLFLLSSTFVLPAWLVLIFAPRHWAILYPIPAYIVPLLLSLLYTILVLIYFSEGSGGYSSLAEVRELFSTDMALLAGWIHYLAFDLFIGVWCAKKMDRARVHRVIQGVVLSVVLLFGPAGLLLTFAVAGMGRFLSKQGRFTV